MGEKKKKRCTGFDINGYFIRKNYDEKTECRRFSKYRNLYGTILNNSLFPLLLIFFFWAFWGYETRSNKQGAKQRDNFTSYTSYGITGILVQLRPTSITGTLRLRTNPQKPSFYRYNRFL